MKIFLNFDQTSVSPSLLTRFQSTSKIVAKEFRTFIFEFDPAAFTHAYLLLGQNPQRYGDDLRHYLCTVRMHFEQPAVSSATELLLNFGTTEFKRRLSEDLGVGLSSLLLVECLGVDWRTVHQIPANRVFGSKRPDFSGFDAQQKQWIWEAKGSTGANTVIEQIEKAIEQVKDYPLAAEAKLAIATYFSGEARAFPSMIFVLDPPLPDAYLPTPTKSHLLHSIHMLAFAGFRDAAEAMRRYLSRSMEAEKLGNEASQRLVNSVEQAAGDFKDAATQESASSQGIDFEGRTYVGHRNQFELDAETNVEVYRLIDAALLDRLKALVADPYQELHLPPSKVFHTAGQTISRLSDGTLLDVRFLRNAAENKQ